MTQQDHLTTEQLSAFLDKQLTPQEQAFFDAHVQTCARCQQALAELRRTVVLLHAMPQPELPRSFALPARLAPNPVQEVVQQRRTARQGRVLPYALRRTVRVVSTIAAVIGFIFILSGLLANVHFAMGGASTASAPTLENSNSHTSVSAGGSQPQPRANTPRADGSPIMGTHQTGTPTAKTPASHTPTTSVTPSSITKRNITNTPSQTPVLPAVLDLSQPAGRLSLGAVLLLLSMLGILLTRRRRRAAS